MERALRFNKRAPLFGKKALGLSEGQLEVESSLTRSCFLTILVQIKKNYFSRKGHF